MLSRISWIALLLLDWCNSFNFEIVIKGCGGLPSKVLQFPSFGGLKMLKAANNLYICKKVCFVKKYKSAFFDIYISLEEFGWNGMDWRDIKINFGIK